MRKGKSILSPSTAGSVSEISLRCRMFPNVYLKRSGIARKSACGGHIYSCSCPTICTRCFPFPHRENHCSCSSANGRNGPPKNWASSGSVISLNTGCDMRKAAGRRRITFCKIRFARNWPYDRKTGRLFISVMASHRNSTGRDGALRRPRRDQRRRSWGITRHSVPPAGRGRGRRSAAALPVKHSVKMHSRCPCPRH